MCSVQIPLKWPRMTLMIGVKSKNIFIEIDLVWLYCFYWPNLFSINSWFFLNKFSRCHCHMADGIVFRTNSRTPMANSLNLPHFFCFIFLQLNMNGLKNKKRIDPLKLSKYLSSVYGWNIHHYFYRKIRWKETEQ